MPFETIPEQVAVATEKKMLGVLTGYLEAAGWYFDWDHIRDVWGDDEDDDDPLEDGSVSLDRRPDAIYSLHGWTLPQWGEYWMEPFSDDPTHANYGKPKTRRYESLKDAIWSQLLREQEPESYAGFFGDPKEKK